MRHNQDKIDIYSSSPLNGNKVPEYPRLEPWELCKKELKKTIPLPFFHSFIRPIKAVTKDISDPSIQSESLALLVPSEKLRRHLSDRYFPLIRSILRKSHFQGEVSLIADASAFNKISTTVDKKTFNPENSDNDAQKIREPLIPFFPNPLNANKIERLLGMDFQETTVVIIGPAGSGKTHLMQTLVQQNSAQARHMSLETFFTEFALACRARQTIEWRKKLRKNKLLIIDDFQFMKKGAQKTQEELRNLIDDFQKRKHTLILCSDTKPGSLPLQPDLQSRLYMAWDIELFWPDFNARIKILKTELDRLKIRLTDEEIKNIACKITGDARKIKSVAKHLEHIDHCSGLNNNKSLNCEKIVADICENSEIITPSLILENVSAFFNVSPVAVVGPARDKKYILARHLTAYLCIVLLKMRLIDIARIIGKKDHCSVIYARKKIENLIKTDLFFAEQVEKLIQKISTQSQN